MYKRAYFVSILSCNLSGILFSSLLKVGNITPINPALHLFLSDKPAYISQSICFLFSVSAPIKTTTTVEREILLLAIKCFMYSSDKSGL